MVESVTSELWVVAGRRPIRPSVRPYVHTYVRETCFRVASFAIFIDHDRDRDATIVDASLSVSGLWRRKLDAWLRVCHQMFSRLPSNEIDNFWRRNRSPWTIAGFWQTAEETWKFSCRRIRTMSTVLVLEIKYMGFIKLNMKNIVKSSDWKGIGFDYWIAARTFVI